MPPPPPPHSMSCLGVDSSESAETGGTYSLRGPPPMESGWVLCHRVLFPSTQPTKKRQAPNTTQAEPAAGTAFLFLLLLFLGWGLDPSHTSYLRLPLHQKERQEEGVPAPPQIRAVRSRGPDAKREGQEGGVCFPAGRGLPHREKKTWREKVCVPSVGVRGGTHTKHRHTRARKHEGLCGAHRMLHRSGRGGRGNVFRASFSSCGFSGTVCVFCSRGGGAWLGIARRDEAFLMLCRARQVELAALLVLCASGGMGGKALSPLMCCPATRRYLLAPSLGKGSKCWYLTAQRQLPANPPHIDQEGELGDHAARLGPTHNAWKGAAQPHGYHSTHPLISHARRAYTR